MPARPAILVDNFLLFPEVVVGKIILSEELFASPGTESVEKSVKTAKNSRPLTLRSA